MSGKQPAKHPSLSRFTADTLSRARVFAFSSCGLRLRQYHQTQGEVNRAPDNTNGLPRSAKSWEAGIEPNSGDAKRAREQFMFATQKPYLPPWAVFHGSTTAAVKRTRPQVWPRLKLMQHRVTPPFQKYLAKLRSVQQSIRVCSQI